MESIVQRRYINEKFRKEIIVSSEKLVKPEKTLIWFRQWYEEGIEVKNVKVPIGLLRFRRDNGRLSTDVISYEKEYQFEINETTDDGQNTLRKLLTRKNKRKTDELKLSIQNFGQQEPAVITCDGFLINGNRRKLAFEQLSDETGKTKYDFLKVVILPGPNDKLGPPPTQIEIEKVENYYQFIKTGKAEYTDFDKALSMRRKNEMGYSYRSQVIDEYGNIGLSTKQINKKVTDEVNKYIKVLELIDYYLEYFDYPSMYNLVSNRWESFLDLNKRLWMKFDSPRSLVSMGIKKDEVGKVQDVCLKLLRARELPRMGRFNDFVRTIPKLLKTYNSKKELLKISALPQNIDDMTGLTPKEIDVEWRKDNQEDIIHHVVRSTEYLDTKKSLEKPIKLLNDVLNILKRDTLDPDRNDNEKHLDCVDLCRDIISESEILKIKFWDSHKKWEKFLKTHDNN